MPMHDWTRTSAGTFHDFHNSWITHIKEALNDGLLPQPYYALGEQRAGDYGPDVLALKAADADLVEFAKSSATARINLRVDLERCPTAMEKRSSRQ